MSRIFTDDEFTGYEFRCETTSANVGFKHVCRVFKDNIEVEEAKSVVNWGNRTWESYPYKSVFESSKANLRDIINGVEKPEIDYDFLHTLLNEDYISDYGEFENGETVILMDSWSQVEGESHYEDEYDEEGNRTGSHKVIDKPSVYHKLVELAEKNLLKPSINSTMLNVDFVFTDEYAKCYDCGTVCNMTYGELTVVDYELLCDKCVNSEDRVASLIEEAREDVRKALKPTVDSETIEGLGYTLVTNETFSFARETWGEARWGCIDVSMDWVQDFITEYDGFVQIYQVEQFDCPFQIWVSNDRLDEAREVIAKKFGLKVA